MGRIHYLSEFIKATAPIEDLNRKEGIKRLWEELQALKQKVEDLEKILVVKS